MVQNCYLCRKKLGACIQCANRNCFMSFHVTCARERGLELRMRQGVLGGELRAYCEKHSPVSAAVSWLTSQTDIADCRFSLPHRTSSPRRR